MTDPVQKADGEALPDLAEVSWLEPYPDSLLDPPPNGAASPEPPSVARDAIELAFVAALQLLSPGQRSALVLHDVLGWSEEAAARLLDLGLPALRDALHRARRALRYHPPRPAAWPSGIDAEETEKQLVRTYIHANERSDVASFESVIRRDATFRVPHDPGATVGRDTILRLWMEGGLGSSEFGRLRCVVTRANRQPAIAAYVMRPGTTAYRAQGMEVLRVEDGTISEIVAFPPDVFAAFGLPLVL